jgi:hypothetical protein
VSARVYLCRLRVRVVGHWNGSWGWFVTPAESQLSRIVFASPVYRTENKHRTELD